MDWIAHYNKNTVSPEEAARIVDSGDRVYLDPSVNSFIPNALAARSAELSDVRVMFQGPFEHQDWLGGGYQDSFNLVAHFYLGAFSRPAHDKKLIDYYPMVLSHEFKPYREKREPRFVADVAILRMSTPNELGYCSFGAGMWDNRSWAKGARKVIAQHDPTFIRTYGDNYFHLSEIDRSVHYTPPEITVEEAKAIVDGVKDEDVKSELLGFIPHMSGIERQQWVPSLCDKSLVEVRALAGDFGWSNPPQADKPFADHVAEIVPDGSTIQIGVGSPGRYLARLGAFDSKKDLGWHSEMATPGVLDLVRDGILNGSRKTIHRDKLVGTSVDGSSPKEIEWAHNNPLIELYDAEYVVNIRTVASHDNYYAINNAISIDLTGQINSETIGTRMWNGTGGQTELHMGAVLSKGGMAITLLRSTAAGGTVSRIVPQLPEGGVVTIPRTFADTIVTEYGVARLLGKSLRERAEELISVAHPDFRSDLRKAAQKLFYP